MADNRMYLRCRGCGEAMVLAKMHTIDEYARHVEFDRDFEPFDLIYENDPDFALGEHYMKKNREKVIKELDSELWK